MKRDNTYRAWDGKKMIYPKYITSGLILDRFENVMQLMGLTDKLGNHYYEGDIIRTPRGDWGVLVYKAPSFEVTISETQSSMYSREWYKDAEILGNIYENPELCK